MRSRGKADSSSYAFFERAIALGFAAKKNTVTPFCFPRVPMSVAFPAAATPLPTFLTGAVHYGVAFWFGGESWSVLTGAVAGAVGAKSFFVLRTSVELGFLTDTVLWLGGGGGFFGPRPDWI